MISINGINEVSDPLLIVVPVVMMLLSGVATGRITLSLRKSSSSVNLSRDFICGSILVCFIFITGFVLFGILQSEAKAFFTAFTYFLTAFSAVGGYFLARAAINAVRNGLDTFKSQHLLFIFAIALFVSIVAYYSILIYQHPIFTEYDSMYLFLLVSKSILLGDGLNHDFYTASHTATKYPPFVQSLNAWTISSFGYSSLRLFPIYFIITAATAMYFLVRSITRNSFLGLGASLIFMITPAMLVVSSRFSLQEDLAFMFFLTASFYFFSEVIRQPQPSRISIIMLMISLSLLPLTREVGLIISVALFFLFLAMKFTHGSSRFRIFLIIMSLLPLHILTIYDIYTKGLTNTVVLRAITLIAATAALQFLASLIKNQLGFIHLIPIAKFLLPLSVPLFFIISNVMTIGGPYPSIILLSKSFNEALVLHREIFSIQDNLELDIFNAIANLPRIDILFTSLALGSIFIFLKIIGFAKIIRDLRNNAQYAMIMAILVIMLVVWSYVLGSGFEAERIRHVMYFVPILTPIVVISMYEQKIPYQLFFLGIVVFATYYFLFHNIYFASHDEIFGGLWIEPNKEPILTTLDVLVGAALAAPITVSLLKQFRGIQLPLSRSFVPYLAVGCILILSAQLFVFSISNIPLSTIQRRDQLPPPGWEQNAFQVIDYLKSAEPGNVFGLRIPAVPFFTNRTNFDLYSPHTFAANQDLMFIKNSTSFKQKINDMNIRYFVIPNKNNYYYNTTLNLGSKSEILNILSTDRSFEHISLKSFDIYKYSATYQINLIDHSHIWRTFNDARVNSRSDNLDFAFETSRNGTTFNRAFSQLQIDLEKGKPIFLFMDYAAESKAGKASFLIEIRDKADEKVIWSNSLDNSSGSLIRKSFELPDSIAGQTVTVRLYAITDGPGEHYLTVRKAAIGYI